MELVWVEQEPRHGLEQPVQTGTIGREGCEIVIPDPEVSRRHAAVRKLDSGLAIEDLGSTNGTFVNDKRVTGIAEVKEGDRLRVGNTVWQLRAPASATEVAAAPTTRQRPSRAEPPSPAPERGHRGDVPPPDVAPSAVRRVLPADPTALPPQFRASPGKRVRGSAARRVEATVVSYAVVIATAAAVAVYLAQR